MSEKSKKVDVKPDKTVFKSLALGGMLGGGGEVCVDVKDGKAVRIRPFHYDWKYDAQEFQPVEDQKERPDPGAADEGAARHLLAGL